MLTCERNGCGPRIKGMRSLIWHANVLVTFWKKNERTANYIEKRRKVQVGNNKKQFRSGLGHASTQAGQYRHTSCACHWDTIFLSWPYANGCSGPQKRSRSCCNLPIRRISGVLVIFLSCVCLIFELQADCTRSLVPTRWKDSGAQGWLLSGLRPNSMLAWYEFGLFQLRPPPY